MYETFQFILHTVEQHLAFNHFLYILHVFSLTYLNFKVLKKCNSVTTKDIFVLEIVKRRYQMCPTFINGILIHSSSVIQNFVSKHVF